MNKHQILQCSQFTVNVLPNTCFKHAHPAPKSLDVYGVIIEQEHQQQRQFSPFIYLHFSNFAAYREEAYSYYIPEFAAF